MTERSAVDTIRGYFYQFDLSILSVLRLKSLNDTIEVECTEDVDIRTATETTAVQCKYYAKTPYTHSVIKDAVKHMASHFKEVLAGKKKRIFYAIRGHYASGQGKLSNGVDVDFLKENFLTYSEGKGAEKLVRYHHVELGLSDADLAEFLRHLVIDVNAKDFDDQYLDVLDALRTIFGATPFTAEYFYYNNALAVIRELSVKELPADRIISKKIFLERIDKSTILFNEWFVEKKGRTAHYSALRKEYFTELNVAPYERFFLIEVDANSYIRHDLKDLFLMISKKWAKLSARDPFPFCPYIYVHGLPDDELLTIKRELSMEDFKIIDGHEFLGAEFNYRAITQRATHGNEIKLKILNSLINITETVENTTKQRHIYQFYLDEVYYPYERPEIKHVKIQIRKMSDIKYIV